MVADTSTQRLAEPVHHTDNSEKPSNYEDKATGYAITNPSILISASCSKIVQWDTINYNQAALLHPIEPQPKDGLLFISCIPSTLSCRCSRIIPFHSDLHLHLLYFKMKYDLYRTPS